MVERHVRNTLASFIRIHRHRRLDPAKSSRLKIINQRTDPSLRRRRTNIANTIVHTHFRSLARSVLCADWDTKGTSRLVGQERLRDPCESALVWRLKGERNERIWEREREREGFFHFPTWIILFVLRERYHHFTIICQSLLHLRLVVHFVRWKIKNRRERKEKRREERKMREAENVDERSRDRMIY